MKKLVLHLRVRVDRLISESMIAKGNKERGRAIVTLPHFQVEQAVLKLSVCNDHQSSGYGYRKASCVCVRFIPAWSSISYITNTDGFVKSRILVFFVIPVKTGIQYLQYVT